MSIGFWQIIIISSLLSPTIIALVLCLILIKQNNYKKPNRNKIYAGFWYRFLAGLIDYIILSIISVILAFIPIVGSDVITVLAEKSPRFPIKLLRIRPSFAFNLGASALNGFF